MIGLLIGRQPLRVERSKAGLVPEQRTASHGHAASQQNIGGGVQPDDGNSSRTKKLGSAGLRIGSSAEREHRGFLVFDGAAQSGAQLIRFHLAKRPLAETLEDLRNTQAGGLFNTLVQIDEAPSQLACEQSANRSLAGAHEPGQAKHLQARLGWSRRKLRH